MTFFIYHTTYIPLNNNTYNIITPHCAEKFCSTRFTKKKKKKLHTCKNEFYWTIVGYSLLVLVHFWMSNQPKEFFVFDTMFLPAQNIKNFTQCERRPTRPPNLYFPPKNINKWQYLKKREHAPATCARTATLPFSPGGVVCECIKMCNYFFLKSFSRKIFVKLIFWKNILISLYNIYTKTNYILSIIIITNATTTIFCILYQISKSSHPPWFC